MTRILVIEDDDAVRENIVELLAMEGYEVDSAGDGGRGIELAVHRVPDLIVCDVNMPGVDGFQVFEVLSGSPETAALPFIFLSARAARVDVRRGMALGADDFITKPFARTELLDSIATRLRRRTASSAPPLGAASLVASVERSRLREPVLTDPGVVMLMEQLKRAATGSIAILLLGETGVGKEILAREVHRHSLRKGQFIAVNCAAITESLLESELFGHEKGAFTGANQTRAGLFEAADGGTLFLDEVGELPQSTQVKLLRVLEEKKVVRVGGRIPRELDIRFVAATNCDLEEAVREGEFRQDLFYRLNGLSLRVPPLRERPTDILALAEYFLQAASASSPSSFSLSDGVKNALVRYHFPGNIRELRNLVERAMLLASGPMIELEHLPASVVHGGNLQGSCADPRAPLVERLQGLERERIVQALRECGVKCREHSLREFDFRRTLVTRLGQFALPRPRKRTPSSP